MNIVEKTALFSPCKLNALCGKKTKVILFFAFKTLSLLWLNLKNIYLSNRGES